MTTEDSNKSNIYKVSVLMSTYNGARYLDEQLESIWKQKSVDIKLIVRDDGSMDSTLKILEKHKANHPEMVFFSDGKRMGPCKSFLNLISRSNDTDYYALADQDDIWDQDKLISAIKMIRELPSNKPALYYANQRLVDNNGSFIRISHVRPMISGGKYSCLSDTLATGCTVLYNKPLADIAARVKPDDFSMHDTWLYVTASLFGYTIYDFKPHMSYRVHTSNAIGTRKKRISMESLIREIRVYFDFSAQPGLKCAKELLRQFDEDFNSEQKAKVMEVAEYKQSLKNRIRLLMDRDLNSENLYRKIRFKIGVIIGNI